MLKLETMNWSKLTVNDGTESLHVSQRRLFSLLAPQSATANLWLADKQLFDYGTAGSFLVYIVALDDGTNSDSGLYMKVRTRK